MGGGGREYKEQRKEKQFGSAKPLKISLKKNHSTESTVLMLVNYFKNVFMLLMCSLCT